MNANFIFLLRFSRLPSLPSSLEDFKQSLRNIFLEWSHYLYCGNINEAEYIKKSFDEAIAFMEKRRIDSNKKKSILRCCFEALGNQIPYISNLLGAISPFLNRKSLLAEERHKWILLTK